MSHPVRCPTCGPTATEPHPRRSGVDRCSNCKEWLPTPSGAEGPTAEIVSLRDQPRPFDQDSADSVLDAARLVYESLNDGQLQRLRSGGGRTVHVPAWALRPFVEAVEANGYGPDPYDDEEVGRG